MWYWVIPYLLHALNRDTKPIAAIVLQIRSRGGVVTSWYRSRGPVVTEARLSFASSR